MLTPEELEAYELDHAAQEREPVGVDLMPVSGNYDDAGINRSFVGAIAADRGTGRFFGRVIDEIGEAVVAGVMTEVGMSFTKVYEDCAVHQKPVHYALANSSGDFRDAMGAYSYQTGLLIERGEARLRIERTLGGASIQGFLRGYNEAVKRVEEQEFNLALAMEKVNRGRVTRGEEPVKVDASGLARVRARAQVDRGANAI